MRVTASPAAPPPLWAVWSLFYDFWESTDSEEKGERRYTAQGVHALGPEWTASSPPHSLPSSWASFQTSSRVHSSSENSLTRQQELLLPSSSFWTFPAPLSHTHLLATCDDAGVPPGWGQTHIHTPGSPFQPELGTYYMLVRSRYGDTCHCTFQKKLFGSSSETVPPFFR